MREVYVQMLDDNVDKILEGKKTTTIRSLKQYEQIGVFVGETALTLFKGEKFTITNMGNLNITEAGGKEEMWESECFRSEGPKYSMAINWLEGKGKMYVYRIERILE